MPSSFADVWLSLARATESRSDVEWARGLVPLLLGEPSVSALWPCFSHQVLHLRTAKYGDGAELVAAIAPDDSGHGYQFITPAVGEVFEAWGGGFFPWKRARREAEVVARLVDGIRQRHEPVSAYVFTLYEQNAVVAELAVERCAYPGLVGRVDALPGFEPWLRLVGRAGDRVSTDAPESWPAADDEFTAGLVMIDHAGTPFGDYVFRMLDDRAWWSRP